MIIKKIKTFHERDLQNLFYSVGWKSAENPGLLKKAFEKSSHVISAWEDDVLAGIIRSMDDGYWSANIDCLVVHKDYQKKGIATQMLLELLNDLSEIQYINICPDDKELINFYLKFGFTVKEGFYIQKINF